MPVRCSECDSRGHTAQECPQISEVEKMYELDRLKTGINFSKYKFIPVTVITPGTKCGKCSKLEIIIQGDEYKCKCVIPQVHTKPIKNFEDLGLDDKIHFNIMDKKRCDFHVPTPIQKYALPIILEGHDVMGSAPTGTGKTAAYIIPMVKLVVERGFTKKSVGYDEPQKPEVLIVAPTRELAQQIHRTALKLTLNMKHPCGIKVIYGGTKPQHQRDKIRQGCNILIGTPGRILHFINDFTISMENTEFLVLDEADKMVDDGFRPDLELIVGKTGMPSKEYRQTLMFSATFRTDLMEIAAESMKKEFRLIRAGIIGSAQPDVKQVFECVETEKQKLIRLKDILVDLHAWPEKRFLEHKCWEQGENRPNISDYLLHVLGKCSDLKILIFVEKRQEAADIADLVSEHLYNFYSSRFQQKYKDLYNVDEDVDPRCKFGAVPIHGRMRQHERDSALAGFKDSSYPILVATNVAARGLDIDHVTHVINYKLPLNLSQLKNYHNIDTQSLKEGKVKRRPVRDQFEEYIHRIGRTGRAGNPGDSISFFHKVEDRHLAISFVRMLEIVEQDVPDCLFDIAKEEASVINAGKKGGKEKAVSIIGEALADLRIKEEVIAGPDGNELWGNEEK